MPGNLNHQWVNLDDYFVYIIILIKLTSGLGFLNPTGQHECYDSKGTNWFDSDDNIYGFSGSWFVLHCVQAADTRLDTITWTHFSPNARYGGCCQIKPGNNSASIILQQGWCFHMCQSGFIPCQNDTCNYVHIAITPPPKCSVDPMYHVEHQSACIKPISFNILLSDYRCTLSPSCVACKSETSTPPKQISVYCRL